MCINGIKYSSPRYRSRHIYLFLIRYQQYIRITAYVHRADTCCNVPAGELVTKGEIMDRRRAELDVSAEVGSQASERVGWNVRYIYLHYLNFELLKNF